MILHEMIVDLVVIVVEVDEEEEVEAINMVVEVEEEVVAIIIILVNLINHVLVLIITNHPGKIVEKEDVELVEVVFRIVNVT
jgi:hypothetical protein